MNRLKNFILKELIIKFDFKNGEYEIGLIWLFYITYRIILAPILLILISKLLS